MNKKTIQFFLSTLLLIGGSAANQAFGYGCGQLVAGDVVLTHDLHCVTGNGLVVAANNTRIDLNGFGIYCAYPYSCDAGVHSKGFSSVQVLGPGAISGFSGAAVNLDGGLNLKVDHVLVTAPADSMGIRVWNVQAICVGTAHAYAFEITNNQVEKGSPGINAQGSCGLISNNILTQGGNYGLNAMTANTLVKGNIVTYNARAGMRFLYSGYNRVEANYVSRNSQEGIAIDTLYNTVTGNSVSFNGTDGIVDSENAGYNVYTVNVAKSNSGADLKDNTKDGQATTSTWNANNVCNKQAGAVPVGVCGPNE